jgi:hypothetical protein
VTTTSKLDPDIAIKRLDDAIVVLRDAVKFAKPARVQRVLDTARRLLLTEGGLQAIEDRARDLEEAGVFQGSDWENPQNLLPSLSRHALTASDPNTVVIEVLNLLRLLAVARGKYEHGLISSEHAKHHLTQVLATNLTLVFTPPSEAQRVHQGRLADAVCKVLDHLVDTIGFQDIVDNLIDEIWRILQQRPIQTASVQKMIMQIASCQANPAIDLGSSGQGADRLVSSLFGPTQASREDPGLETYRERLASMDVMALQLEAGGCARAMHDTGLVSAYHAELIKHLLGQGDHLLAEGLGLSSTGRDCLLCYHDLVHALIESAVSPQTAQAVYGLSLMLERGILYQQPLAPALWRQLSLTLSETAKTRLTQSFGDGAEPHQRLLEGVLCILGQPLGVGQGNNPTCQSARALSMWAYNDPDYLLQMVAWAARDDEIIMHFEGQPISSKDSQEGLANSALLDLDAVSVIVVPHLDRIYAQMGRLCANREGDPHRWVNPEFHGWWSGRGFRINVDVATGNIVDIGDFLRHFYASYHPFYNGNQPLIHPQPAGIAVTDSSARFVGWHAITILRVALDPQQEMRVFFYNPNNDSGQDWGNGVRVSTSGHGERYGESSLPFEQFVSRLYIFHFDPLEHGEPAFVDNSELQRVVTHMKNSWAETRWTDSSGHDLEETRI